MGSIAKEIVRKTVVSGFFHKFLFICLIVLIAQAIEAFGEDSGFKGQVWDKNVTQRISDVKITFKSGDGNFTKTAISDKRGLYRITLPSGKYYVVAEHDGFKPYSSYPGVFVVSDGIYRQGNLFMEKK